MKHKEQLVAETWRRKYHYFCYRYDPVPFTGRGSRLYHNIWRHPKTTQERRLSFADPEFVRGKRSSRNIPNCWDDWYRTDLDNRSWKKNKVRKQWMKNI